MTSTYGFGFDDLARPRSRRARIGRIDALATLLDTALVIPGTGVRFGLDALIGLFPVVGDIITTALSHGIASLFGRGDAARRSFPMSPEDLLEAALLIYLRGLGLTVPPLGARSS